MKKVLLVVPLSTLKWGSKNTGGVDSVCQMIVKGLQGNSSEAFYYRVVAFDPTNSINNTGVVSKLNESLEVVQYNVSDLSTNRWYKLPGILHQRKIIIEQNKLFQPDVIHSHLSSWLIAIGAKVTTLATLHNYKKIGRKPRGRLNNFLYEKVIPTISPYFISSYTCVSGFLKEAIINDINKPISVVYNPVEPQYLDCVKNNTAQQLTLVTCALLSAKKGIHHIIEVLALLKQQGIKTQFKVIGPATDSTYMNSLTKLINERGVQREVVFVGGKTTTDIVGIYACSSVGLFLSDEETFGLVPLEMLAAGLPVIATDTGIMTDFNNANIDIPGLTIVKQTDYQCIATKIIDIQSSRKSIASNYITENFSVTAVIKSYENEYRKVLSHV
jgi:glycosyltransferase involved in cell wall biosynthesis